MFTVHIGRPPITRTIRVHPSWLVGPIGLLGCLVIGLAVGYFESPTVLLIAAGAAAALGWMAVVVLRPEWALLFYAFAGVNLNGVELPLPLGGLRLSPDIVLTSLLIVGTMIRLLQTKRPLARLPISAPYLVFLAVPLITLLWSPVPFQSLKGTFRFVGYYALMWLIVDVVTTRKQVLRMLAAVALSPAVPILVGAYQLATGGGQLIQAGEEYSRVYALAGGPFTLAFYLVLIIPLLVVFFLEAPRQPSDGVPWILRKRWLLGLLLAGTVVTLILTFIRGSWFAIAAALLLLGAVRFRRLLVALPILVLGLVLVYGPAQSRLLETLDPNSTLFGRLRLWRFAWEWILSSPLVGVGMKAFEFYYILLAAPYTAQGLDRREQFLVGNRPHNELIGFLLDVGVVGTVALIVVLVILIRTALRVYRRCADTTLSLVGLAFLISSAGMLVGAVGDNVFSQPTVAVYYWMLAGIVMAIEHSIMNRPASGAAAQIEAGARA